MTPRGTRRSKPTPQELRREQVGPEVRELLRYELGQARADVLAPHVGRIGDDDRVARNQKAGLLQGSPSPLDRISLVQVAGVVQGLQVLRKTSEQQRIGLDE